MAQHYWQNPDVYIEDLEPTQPYQAVPLHMEPNIDSKMLPWAAKETKRRFQQLALDNPNHKNMINILVQNIPQKSFGQSATQPYTDTYIYYWAANSHTDPSNIWSSVEEAGDNINYGVVPVHRQQAILTLLFPGSYFNGNEVVPPNVNYKICWGDECSSVRTFKLDGQYHV